MKKFCKTINYYGFLFAVGFLIALVFVGFDMYNGPYFQYEKDFSTEKSEFNFNFLTEAIGDYAIVYDMLTNWELLSSKDDYDNHLEKLNLMKDQYSLYLENSDDRIQDFANHFLSSLDYIERAYAIFEPTLSSWSILEEDWLRAISYLWSGMDDLSLSLMFFIQDNKVIELYPEQIRSLIWDIDKHFYKKIINYEFKKRIGSSLKLKYQPYVWNFLWFRDVLLYGEIGRF